MGPAGIGIGIGVGNATAHWNEHRPAKGGAKIQTQTKKMDVLRGLPSAGFPEGFVKRCPSIRNPLKGAFQESAACCSFEAHCC